MNEQNPQEGKAPEGQPTQPENQPANQSLAEEVERMEEAERTEAAEKTEAAERIEEVEKTEEVEEAKRHPGER